MFPEEYRLQPTGTNVLVKRVLLQSLVTFAIFGTVFFVRNYYTGGHGFSTLTLMIWAGILVYSVVAGLYRALRRQKTITETFVITIDENTVTGRVNDTEINFSYLEIREINKLANGSILIRGGVDNDVIVVPAGIEHKAELESTLETIMPLTIGRNPKTIEERYRWPIFILFIASFIVFIAFPRRWITLSSGAILIGIFTWSLVRRQRNVLVGASVRRKSWVALLPIAVILIRMMQVIMHWRWR